MKKTAYIIFPLMEVENGLEAHIKLCINKTLYFKNHLFQKSSPKCSGDLQATFNSIIDYTLGIIRMLVFNPNDFLQNNKHHFSDNS